MRIRNRFRSSSLSSSQPLSDPQLSPSLAAVQVQPHPYGNIPSQSDPHNQPLQDPTGQEMVIGTENPVLVYPPNHSRTQELQEIEGKEMKDERWKTEEEKKISNDIRKESISSAEVVDMSSSSSCQAFDGLGEGERILVPPKKRKGSFGIRMGSKDQIIMIKPKMKSKTNKKCLQENDHINVEDDHEKQKVNITDKEGGTSTKKRKLIKRGSVIMEGSRCSRVNGRGWRCCQQTLVGYSLCEHHLGKGRLRSMTSVRNRATAAAPTTAPHEDHSRILTQEEFVMTKNKSSTTNYDINGREEDERKLSLLMMSREKRMMKIGAVKARSIRSLLGQTQTDS